MDLPLLSARKTRTNSSRFSSVVGFLPRTRRELSPRPIPSCMRPCESTFKVANKLADTVTSRTAGFLTQVPKGTVFVFSGIKGGRGEGALPESGGSQSQAEG